MPAELTWVFWEPAFFKLIKLPEANVLQLKKQSLGEDRADHFVALYVGRNARRKMPSDIIISFKQFLDELEQKYGHRKATLLMHTEPLDPEGPNLFHVLEMLHMKDHVVFSKDRVGFNEMNVIYNVSDVVDSKKETGQASKSTKAKTNRLREVHGNDEPDRTRGQE